MLTCCRIVEGCGGGQGDTVALNYAAEYTLFGNHGIGLAVGELGKLHLYVGNSQLNRNQERISFFRSNQHVIVRNEFFLYVGQCVVCLACSVDILLALVGVTYLADSINQVDDCSNLFRNEIRDRAELFPLLSSLVGLYSRNRHVECSIRLINIIEHINTQCRRSQRVADEGLQGFALVESHIVYFCQGARQGCRYKIRVISKCTVLNRVDTLRQHYL